MAQYTCLRASPDAYKRTKVQYDDDDPTGGNLDARQVDDTNAPSSLAARAADFIEASGHLHRTERPDICAHRLPQDRVPIRFPGPKGPFHTW